MRLLPRRADEPADEPTPSVETVVADRVVAPKGRPTPKRRDSEPRRGPVTAPKTRKEAVQRQKAQASRPASADTPAQRRQRMLAGDPSALPRRDAGPFKALARDYVDSRRMLSNGLLLLFPLIFLTVFVRTPFINLLILAIFIVVMVEWVLTGRKLLKIADQRGIDVGTNKVVGIGMYAGSRAYLPRKWRVPRARVSMGDSF